MDTDDDQDFHKTVEDEEETGKGLEDSSEEEEEGSEEERAVREGFIADEDEDEEEEEEDDRSSRKRKRKSRHKHKQKERKKHRSTAAEDDEDDDLDEDDLELLAENTGLPTQRKAKRRLRRAGSVASDDIDQDPDDALNRIFDDEDDPFENQVRRRDTLGDDELDDFIEEDEFPDDEPAALASKTNKKKGKAVSAPQGNARRQKQAGRLMGALAPDVSGISKDAWEEVIEVFGNGDDYAWAIDTEDNEEAHLDLGEAEYDAEGIPVKSTAVQLKDIFEPSEIKERMLTEADEAIRLLDIPERTQLASAGLANANSTEPVLGPEELDRAAEWVAKRISDRCTEKFIQPDRNGFYPLMKGHFIVAVKDVLEFFLTKYLEPPFVYMHRQDYITHHDPKHRDSSSRTIQFLTREELWKVHTLALKYVALLERKKGLKRLFKKLGTEDDYFEECFARIQSVEEVSDLMQWLTLKYGLRLREAQADVREDADALAVDLDTDILNGAVVEAKKAVRYKKASRESRYERAKSTIVNNLAKELGVSARDLSADYLAGTKYHVKDDPPLLPVLYAEQFCEAGTEFEDAKKVLEAAKLIVSTDIGRDPLLKKHLRNLFRDNGVVTVTPTESGMVKITELHPYFAFKYLSQKPFSALKQSSQYLQIMAAEQELLVNVQVHLLQQTDHSFKKNLIEMFKSDSSGELAASWNDLREEVLMHAIEHMLLPDAARWAKNHLKDEAEEFVAQKCADELEFRADVAPFRPSHLFEGEVPSVVAISNGAGDPKRDSVFVIFLDQAGRFRDHMKLDNLRDPMPRQAFSEFLQKRTPDVIVVGGFSASTFRLLGDVKTVAGELSERMKNEMQQQSDLSTEAASRMGFPVIVARDDTARLNQQSKRAEEEFGDLPPLGRYCVALARYVQSPLNEYAAAASDLTAISFHPDQQFLPRDTLQLYLERALVNIVNAVGVDINRAVNDHYYQHLLQYVCGLGPRKAQKLIKSINTNPSIEGTLGLRNELITENLVTKNIFYNCAGFLRIKQDDLQASRDTDPDILDDTRIHPEDYDVARKMAADSQELDEEDLTGQPPSQVVSDLLVADGGNGAAKLDDLNLDDFAEELFRLMGAKKRLTLYQIRSELQNPYQEKRAKFDALTPEQMFDLWTGENEATLSLGAVIPVKIIKVRDRGLTVRLDSGIEGFIEQQFMVDEGTPDMTKFPVGSTTQALVTDIHKDRFMVELNSQPKSVAASSTYRKKVETDRYFDTSQMEMDKGRMEAKKKTGHRRAQRVIKHPNFHNFNAGQAEQHLANLQRGDCVIRPSSRGTDHLAVTWKVDTGIYQHIDVLELDKPNEFSLGRILKIGGRYSYCDLDELIVSHVRAMARKVEEMIAHEKYKGSHDDMSNFLKTYLMANPDKSVYAFCINKESPGNFLIGFKADKNSQMQTWHVKVSPGAYELHGTQAGDMLSLCNAFKTQYTARAAAATAAAQGGRTDGYGRQTPALAGSGRTPSHGGRTPMLNNRTPLVGSRTPLVTPRYPGSTPQYPSLPAGQSYPQQAPARYPAPPPPGTPNTWNGAPGAYPMNANPPPGHPYPRYMEPPPPAPPSQPPGGWGPTQQPYV